MLAIQFKTGFKFDFKTRSQKGNRRSLSENKIGSTSIEKKRLEHPPPDQICSDLDLGRNFGVGFKTGFKTDFKLDQTQG